MGAQGEFNDFSFVCIISPTQINFSIYNELALPLLPAPLPPAPISAFPQGFYA